MKTTMLLAALAALALVPLAAADQDIQEGPLTVRTTNYDQGNGCGGANGNHQRTAEASAEYYPGEKAGVFFQQTCVDYDDGTFVYHQRSGYLFVGRSVDNNQGPNAQVYWSDSYDSYEEWENRSCFTSLYFSGPGLNLGCLPLGAQWPLMPTLP